MAKKKTPTKIEEDQLKLYERMANQEAHDIDKTIMAHKGKAPLTQEQLGDLGYTFVPVKGKRGLMDIVVKPPKRKSAE